MFCQDVAQATGLPLSKIRNGSGSTEDAPDSGTTSGSRQTLLSGEAVRGAAMQLKAALDGVGGDLDALNGQSFFYEYFEPTDKLGADVPNPKSHIAYGYATHVVILDDDGQVKSVYAAHDSGRVVNPIAIQGQIEGGVLMSMGYALTEDFPLKDGVPTAKFGTLGLLRANQIPDIHAICVEKEALLPVAWGAKGIGEIAAIPTAPAIQGAYYALDGVFRTKLPLENTWYRKPKDKFTLLRDSLYHAAPTNDRKRRRGDLAMRTLIRGGTIATEQDVFQGDILIRGRSHSRISSASKPPTPKSSTPPGRLVLPGAVDIHTHMDLDVGIARVIDDFYTGTVAAACGGTTTIVDHMAFGPKGCSPWHQVKEYHRLADGVAAVDYGFHGVLQHVDDAALDDMAQIAVEEGITSFKAYMTYDGRLDDLDLMRVLERAAREGILIAAHCENHGIVTHLRERFVAEGKTQARWHPVSRPPEAEAEAVNRLLCLARAAGDAPVYVVHLSTRLGLEALRRARAAGQKRFGAETCPQYLLLDEALYADPGRA